MNDYLVIVTGRFIATSEAFSRTFKVSAPSPAQAIHHVETDYDFSDAWISTIYAQSPSDIATS